MIEQVIREFPITVYGNLTKYSDTISKGRCRIFYKYANRNGTYITDEFAEKLLSTIPYTPVKGIYDNFDEDYTDHGNKRSLGRIYGIVPENPNLQWEKHLDEDGIEREYACVDVLIFTALYEEAGEIIGKAQSMEIYEPSIKGSWKIINGRRMFEYTEGSFLGLQVLGEDVEPCFEGAAFFSLYSSLKQLVDEIKEYTLKLPEINTGGQSQMFEKLNFKLSDSEKHNAIWNLINPNYNEEGGWTIEYAICDIYDDYAALQKEPPALKEIMERGVNATLAEPYMKLMEMKEGIITSGDNYIISTKNKFPGALDSLSILVYNFDANVIRSLKRINSYEELMRISRNYDNEMEFLVRATGLSGNFRIIRYRLEKDSIMSRVKEMIDPGMKTDVREAFINKLITEANVTTGSYTSSDALSVRTTFKGIGAELVLIDKI